MSASAAPGEPQALTPEETLLRETARDFAERELLPTAAERDAEERFDRSLDLWLAERYYAADMHHVAKVCREHPGSCDSPDQYERLLLQSHNRFISSDTDRQAGEIRSDYQADRNRERLEEEHAQEAAAVAAMMATVAVTTHIHNHPSVFQ